MSIKSKTLHILLTAKGFVILLVFILSMGSGKAVAAQRNQNEATEDIQTRQIKLSDFTKERPAAKPGPASQASPKMPSKTSTASGDSAAWNTPTYHRVTPKAQPRTKRIIPQPVEHAKSAPAGPTEIKEVGVTLWRLRPAKPTDNGPALSVVEQGRPMTLVPERIEGTSPVSLGDLVRISIESPRAGYLYVIDREQYADGQTGRPQLIFPSLRVRGGDNKVAAGNLIDIPDQRESLPFFKITSDRKPGQPELVGDLLTVLITPQPLPGLSIGRNPISLDPQQVERWEAQWGSELVELLEMNGGAGKTWTREEKMASEAVRSLTREDPTPQTIYRVATKPNSPVMLTVQLLYDQPNL